MKEGSSSPLLKKQKFDRVDTSTNNNLDNTTHAHDHVLQPLPQSRRRCQGEKSLHIAPMIRVSNREFRQLIRILSKRCVLWTEMVVDETIYYCSRSKSSPPGANNREKVDIHLDYDKSIEHPIVCQIGGINPVHTAFTSKLVTEEYCYDEVSLNMGCPSDRVSGKGFGAVLMKQGDRACELVRSLRENCGNVPISVKLRIGVDDDEEFEFIRNLIQRLHKAGCDRFYMHARKVHLKGLNPAQNRIVPPLNYPIVYRLCEEFPDCGFWINGGISNLEAARDIVYGRDKTDYKSQGKNLGNHSVPCKICNYPNGSCIAPPAKVRVPSNLRGCMLGRAAMDNPSIFWDCDRYFYGESKNPCKTRREVLDQYIEYLEKVYPRRCCDDRNDLQTNRIPAPSVVHQQEFCSVCSTWRKHLKQGSPTKGFKSFEETSCIESTANLSCRKTDKKPNKQKAKTKITTHVVRRSLRPILGIFFGLSTSRSFRRKCEELIQNKTIRDCGPAFALVLALQVVPDHFLDCEFVRTEDLQSSNIVEHISPQQQTS